METGTIFNIQKYSTHDGPGIRTTVFLKGCPLNCWWCHNPESQDIIPEIMFYERRCLGCKACMEVCRKGAICFNDGKISLKKDKCSLCYSCVSVCPAKARQVAGKRVSVDYVAREVMKDRIFYEESGGGVTFSGGEPLMQPEFLYELLSKCKDEDIHTTLDTSGFSSWQVLQKISSKVDLFLYDVKFMDNEKHKKYTGVTNDLILENLTKLSAAGSRIYARIPLIPGINDDDENIILTGRFLSSLTIEQVNILPYHDIAFDKYNRLSKECALKDLQKPTDTIISKVAESLKEFGLKVKIGG